MTVNLSDVEIAALALLQQDAETPEDTLHRLLVPFVADAGEKRLQVLADTYRAMSADDQLTLTNTASNLRIAALPLASKILQS